MAGEPYLSIAEPKSYAKADILEYFGIPPQPESDLFKNIKAKRQFWGKRANGPGGREVAQTVKDWIQKLSKLLEDGEFPDAPIVHTSDGGFKVVGEPQNAAELAEQLAAFLLQGDIANVLAVAQKAMERWGSDPEVLLILALTLSEILRDYSGQLKHHVFALADAVTLDALTAQPNNAEGWRARARFALASGAMAEIQTLEARAYSHGIRLPAEVHGIIATASFRTGDIDTGIYQLIRMVDVSGGDPAVRSVATDAILTEVVNPLLPIMDRKGAQAYVEAVQVAAWLADGVPESQSELIAYRIWAQQAVGGVFIGNFALKSFIGVLTGFLALPIYGNAASRPGWRVLRDGPREQATWKLFPQINSGGYIEDVHAKATRKFDWQTHVGQPWPTPQQSQALVREHGLTKNGIAVKKR
ncbi:hypothetical protein V5R04_14690 [Jonesiaceae bacterium BS-20]|uniref:Uncharacterized protein n=1 Tax=Jonesiaceae bacterium BS-20 TaxID=3120821 RepID=A0AAU7DU06_9MICO